MLPDHQLTPKLKSLRLSGILETVELRTQQAITEQLWSGDFLQRLIEDEVERRGQKQLALRLRRATLDQTKTLESFDFGFNPTLNRQQIFDLGTCRFVDQHASLLIQGPAGVGKSHLAQALAHEACRRGYDVLFIPAARMLAHLHGGRADGTYDRRLLTYTRPDSARPRRLWPQAARAARAGGLLRCHQRALRAGGDDRHLEPGLLGVAGVSSRVRSSRPPPSTAWRITPSRSPSRARASARRGGDGPATRRKEAPAADGPWILPGPWTRRARPTGPWTAHRPRRPQAPPARLRHLITDRNPERTRDAVAPDRAKTAGPLRATVDTARLRSDEFLRRVDTRKAPPTSQPSPSRGLQREDPIGEHCHCLEPSLLTPLSPSF